MKPRSRRAVFLDRDGVINRAMVRDGRPHAPQTLEGLEVLPKVPQALDALRRAGFLNIVVTNQPDVGAGTLQRDVVEAMHAWLLKKLPLDAVKVCYHVDADQCDCRKPRPGLILAASPELGIDVPASFVVGDRWRDIEAGQRAGCRGLFFIDYGYSEKRPKKPYVAVNSLEEAVDFILQSDSP